MAKCSTARASRATRTATPTWCSTARATRTRRAAIPWAASRRPHWRPLRPTSAGCAAARPPTPEAMQLDYLVFDASDEDSGRESFDAMASVAPDRLPALLAEVAAVLRWAHG